MLALAGCGGDERTAAELPADVGTELAGHAADVHQRLDAGDPIGAHAQAEELEAVAERAIAEGYVPASLAGELRESVARLVRLTAAAVPPPPPPPPPPTPPPAPQADEDDKQEGKGKGKGKEKGKEKKDDGEGDGGGDD